MNVKCSQCLSEDMTRLLLLLVLLVAATVDARRVIRAAPKSEKTGCYIVKLEDDTSHDRFKELKKTLLEESVDHHIYGVEGSVSKIFAVKLPEESLDKVPVHDHNPSFMLVHIHIHGVGKKSEKCRVSRRGNICNCNSSRCTMAFRHTGPRINHV